MNGGTVLDVLLGLVLVGYAVSGFRHGLLVSALSLVGFLGGGFVGMMVLPGLFERWSWARENDLGGRVLLILGVFLMASVGQRLALAVGSRLRDRVHAGPARALDSVLGAVATVSAASVLVWFVAGGLRSSGSPLARSIGQSAVLRAIDTVVPPQTAALFTGFRQMLDRGGFPRVFEGIGREPIAPVDPPGAAIASSDAVVRAAASVVKVTGLAEACARGQEGSGFVVATDRVLTNAHVVAGMPSPTVQVGGSRRSLPARVVVFDPARDLAVLAVDGLGVAPLPLGGQLADGDEAVVAGYPLDGPLRLDPARVRATVDAVGSDIYDRPGVRRQVYSLYTRVEPGNSGGPLLDSAGRVVGVVFAKSLDDDLTGYAVTLAEARPILDQAASHGSAVPVGACTAG
ncbi:MAG: MarP family serine protease [Dermatophilaceae bacterium]